MLALWHKSWTLIRQRPIVAGPVVCYAVLSYYFTWLSGSFRGWLAMVLVRQFTQTRSVLGNISEQTSLTATASTRIEAILMPVGFLTFIITAYFLIAALVVTVAIVEAPGEHSEPTRASILFLKQRNRHMWFLALIMSALLGIVGSVLGRWLFPLAVRFQDYLDRASFLGLNTQIRIEHTNLAGWLAEVPLVVLTIYVMAPLLLQLIQPVGYETSGSRKQSARLACFLTASVIFIVSAVVSGIEAPLLDRLQSSLADIGIDTVASVVRSLPYIPLFVAFAFLSGREELGAVCESSILGVESPTRN
jgi:hypothetical protein